MWMKSARSPYSDFTCSATSVTGPQTLLSHSAGVANSSTIGLWRSSASARSTSCIVSGGMRVSIASTLPPDDATVGVCTRIARSPGPGTRLSSSTATSVSAATSRPFNLVTAATT